MQAAAGQGGSGCSGQRRGHKKSMKSTASAILSLSRKSGRIAVTVINHMGGEVIRVFRVA